MASMELEPGGVEVWRSTGCELRQWSPAPGVLCNRFVGDIAADLTPAALAFLRRVADGAPHVIAFTDAELVTSYDIVFRVRVMLGLQRLHDRLEEIHAFSRSNVALTGMRAANLVLGKIVAHASRQSFEAALAKVVAARTGVCDG